MPEGYPDGCRASCHSINVCLQFAYAFLLGSFPFNSFLAGMASCIGFFVLTGRCCTLPQNVQHGTWNADMCFSTSAVCLRMQVDPSNHDFKGRSPERAFADYVLCNCLLHLIIWNYMG